MNKLISLSKALYSLGLSADSKSIMKIAGDAEAKYLEELNFKSWLKGKDTTPVGDKKEFWSALQREFREREGGGPIFDSETVSLIKSFDQSKLPKKESKNFIKWLGRWIRDWNQISVADQNMILDWWSATGGAEEGKSLDERSIGLLTPQYAIQRAEEYHDGEGFYFDPTDSYLTPANDNIVKYFGDGFKIVYVRAYGEMPKYHLTEADLTDEDGNVSENKSSHDRIVEGNKMGICLGKKMRFYQDNEDGNIYSLRNSSNEPCVTIRVDWTIREENIDTEYEDEDGEIQYDMETSEKDVYIVKEFFGLGNSVPSKKYADYVLSYFRSLKEDDADVEIEDQRTLALTKMNSQNKYERQSGLNQVLASPGFASKIFSIDWKIIKEESPDLFNKMILDYIFTAYGDDQLDPEKLGGDEEKIRMIRGAVKNYISAKYSRIFKDIRLSSGNQKLVYIAPELLYNTKLQDLLFPADSTTFLDTMKNDAILREFIWNNKIKHERLRDINNLAVLTRIVEIFKKEIIEDGGRSRCSRDLVRTLLKDAGKSGSAITALEKIDSIIPAAIEGESIYEIDTKILHYLSDNTRGVINKQLTSSLSETSIFLIPTILEQLNLSLTKEELIEVLRNSNMSNPGRPKEIYDLIQYLKSLIVRINPLEIFNKELWKNIIMASLAEADFSSETDVHYWIYSASLIPSELKDALFSKLKESTDAFKIAWGTYELGVFFSRDELQELLDYHKINGNPDSQF